MPIFIPPGFGEVTIKMRNVQGKNCVNVIGVRLSGQPTQAHLNSFSSGIGPALTNILSTAGAYLGLRLLIGQDGGPPVIMESTQGSGGGGRGGEMATPQVQHLIKKVTQFATRHGVGRVFVPDVLEANVGSTGDLVSAENTLLAAYATALASACVQNEFTAMVLLPADGATAPLVVTSVQPSTRVATLRRRYTR